MENKSRYEQMKELSLEEMAVVLSWYSFCMDTIIEWLRQEGEL